VEQDRKELEDEPLAEADGFDCDVPADECEVGVTERDGKADDAEASLREEIFETYQPITSILVESPVDGMPVPADERHDLAAAHPFTRETVVCVEDDTVFVELFDDEVEARGWERKAGQRFTPVEARGVNTQADDVLSRAAAQHPLSEPSPPTQERESTLFANVLSRYHGSTGAERERRQFEPSRVEWKFGVAIVREDDFYVAVRMRRERCKHFLRQVMANDDVPNPKDHGHMIRFYNCAARRSVGGAYMSLRDEAVYACDYRNPVDPATTEKYLESFDRLRLNGKRHLELVKPFRLA